MTTKNPLIKNNLFMENMEQKEATCKTGNNGVTSSSYQMRPSLEENFKGSKIKEIIREVMTEKLQGKNYNTDDAKAWTKDIADSVNGLIKDRVVMPRYKFIVQVMLAQQLGAGCHYYCKCCWDVESDSQTSDVFSNTSLFCVTTVFGVYLY